MNKSIKKIFKRFFSVQVERELHDFKFFFLFFPYSRHNDPPRSASTEWYNPDDFRFGKGDGTLGKLREREAWKSKKFPFEKSIVSELDG